MRWPKATSVPPNLDGMHANDAEIVVLHALRLKGFADVGTVAASLSLSEGDVESVLRRLEHEGLVVYRAGRLTGWALTAFGRKSHRQEVVRRLEEDGVRHRIEGTYRRFLPVNRDLLTVCTNWQMREIGGRSVLNDHADVGYDRAVLKRLDEVDRAARPLCDELTEALARFGLYATRLANALDRVHAGDYDWFTKPVIDSYHTVWFELHEDLLSTLGIERSKEEPS